jgi:hypothetical protein
MISDELTNFIAAAQQAVRERHYWKFELTLASTGEGRELARTI